jgi:penicillin-insensitive murein DD-endopeptidase
VRLISLIIAMLVILAPAQAVFAAGKSNAWSKFLGPDTGTPQSFGGYANGCLSGGEALPSEGRGYQVVRLSRNRYYGHPVLIDFLQDLGNKVADRDLGLMLVADMNQPRGGPMPSGHSSHQSGLDADIWLPLNYARIEGQRDHLQSIEMADRFKYTMNYNAWSEKQAELIRIAAEDDRVARIFLNPRIKLELCQMEWDDRSWLRKVRPWFKHHSHFHVRLKCPPGSTACKNQASPPPGDGCGKELAEWHPDKRKLWKKSSGKKTRPPLPQQCQQMISAK